MNVALPGPVPYGNGRTMRSGILKRPIVGKIFLDVEGLRGDGCANTKIHGGPDKAVCVYCVDHYPFWEKELSKKLPPGAFGENLTVSLLQETRVHIGDIFRIGDVEVQCTQPRQPCATLNKVFGLKEMACRVQTTGYTGYYLRVLKPGWIEADMEIQLVKEDPGRISVAAANQIMHKDKRNVERIREILSIEPLSRSWRESIQKRLEKYLSEETTSRLQ